MIESTDPPIADCTGDEQGFLPLGEALNLLFGQEKGEKMSAAHPGWLLWQACLSAKQRGGDWPVRLCRHDDGLGNAQTFVHVHDLLAWVLAHDTRDELIPVGFELWSPDALTAERERLERDLKQKGPKGRATAKRGLQRIDALLRRWARLGDDSGPDTSGDAGPERAPSSEDAPKRSKRTRIVGLRRAVMEAMKAVEAEGSNDLIWDITNSLESNAIALV
jgi:hypothetical protein